MKPPAALLGALLFLGAGPIAASALDGEDAVGLFADQAMAFVVEAEEVGDAGRVFRLRSAEPIERTASGDLYLRATVAVAAAPDRAAAAAEIERRLAAADPDTGLSYAWDFVAAGDGAVVHLNAACTFSEEAFGKASRALARRLADPGAQPNAGPAVSFWCRCGGGCRAGVPFANEPAPIQRVPQVRRPEGADEGDYDNRLDPSGTWTSDIGELSLMHHANRLAFSYFAVFGATAHICEGAGVAGLVGTDRYEHPDEQGTVAFTISEAGVHLELAEGIASFCGAGWTGDRFSIDRFASPATCAVAAEHTHLHVVDTVDLERTPFTLGRGSPVELVPARHTGDDDWVLGRSPGLLTTRMGMIQRAALSCPPGKASAAPGQALKPPRGPRAVFALAGGSGQPATRPAPARLARAQLARGGTRPAAGSGAAQAAGTAALAATEPSGPERRPSLGYLFRQWLPRVGIFLMAMAILGFLAVAALLSPPLWAWFIYLFLLPFLVWIPGMTLNPAAGWALAAAWLAAFPLLRRWIYGTPSGKKWLARQRRRLARFEGAEASDWGVPWSAGSSRPAEGSRGGASSVFTGRGGRFGGGGSSSRW